MSLDTLRKVEADIVRAIIAEALRLGYRISVSDGEELIEESSNAYAILKECAGADENMLYFSKDYKTCGAVWIIYGEGATCIADYTDNTHMQAIMAPAEAIVRAALN